MTEPQRASPANTRVSACSACRLHKVRCDAAARRPQPCSRCHAKGLQCEITSGPVQARMTRRELQNELESLRRVVRPSPGAGGAAVIPPITSSSPRRVSPGRISDIDLHRSPGSVSHSAIERESVPTFPGEQTTSEPSPPASNGTLALESSFTLSRSLDDLEVRSETIDACFDIFFTHYILYVPVLEDHVRPNAYYQRSPLLFWAIVAIGARKYDGDPTLLTSLATRLTSLLNTVVLARENPLATIQALALFCSWPLPFVSLSNDTSPLQAGLLLSHAFLTGLNVQGTGQDFHDAKLKVDKAFAERRTRLWFLCITICQRVHCCHGLVPPVGLNTYTESEAFGAAHHESVLARIVFEKRLSAVQSAGIIQLERVVASTDPREREVALYNTLEPLLGQLRDLEQDCHGELGGFYLGSAKLQLLIFQLLMPRDSLTDTKLRDLHDLACTIIETLRHIEEGQSPPNTISHYAPIFMAHYSILAAFTILKVSRSHLSETIDALRGRKAYFFVIQLLRNMSVQSGDCFNRTMGILTQLWSSKNVFKKRDGTVDSLTLRCGGRLAMSVSYDCYWWWRWEFAGQAYPYEESNAVDTNMPRRPHLRARTSGHTGDINSSLQASILSDTSDPALFVLQTGADWFGLGGSGIGEDYWLGGPDLRLMDWAPPLISEPFISGDGVTMTDQVSSTWHSGDPQS